MNRLQVLVAAMNQQDLSLADRMNLSCDVLIANQTDHYAVRTEQKGSALRTMISTPTRGVGLNRNIALLASRGDILLLADDDMVYRDDLEENVLAAFEENPKAQVIIFSVDILRQGEVTQRRYLKKKRLHLWNAMRYGTYTIAIRRSALLQSNLSFHQHFGGGCIYGCGEDSLFLRDCFRHKLRVISHSYVLGSCCKDSSSWFTGYNEKYFYDKGALMGQLFPRIPRLMALYFSLRFKHSTQIPALQRYRWMLAGIQGGKKLLPYSEHK